LSLIYNVHVPLVMRVVDWGDVNEGTIA